MKTAQEIFDTVANHLLTQREKAQSVDSTCYYRKGKLKCAVGCLIPDDVYYVDMEGHNAEEIVNILPGELQAELKPHINLLNGLQKLHDTIDVKQWLWCLRIVAVTYGLNYGVTANYL